MVEKFRAKSREIFRTWRIKSLKRGQSFDLDFVELEYQNMEKLKWNINSFLGEPLKSVLLAMIQTRDRNWGWLWLFSDPFFGAEGAEQWELLKIFGKNWGQGPIFGAAGAKNFDKFLVKNRPSSYLLSLTESKNKSVMHFWRNRLNMIQLEILT